jgi:hypothetical protein
MIPSKKQWHDWTLPSKASYIGLVLAIVFFLASYPTYLYYEHLKVISDHPKIVVNSQNKPFLRYEEQNGGKISFSYELSFKNNGKNTASQIKLSSITQKLMVENNAVVEVHSDNNEETKTIEGGNIVPNQLVSNDTFYKIFKLNGSNLSKNQLSNLVEKYNDEKLSVILDIKLECKDEITGKTYITHETLDIFKNKVLILK